MNADFDWKLPDYTPIFERRSRALIAIREKPECLPALRDYYRQNTADFINDWGVIHEPRNVEIGLPATIPFCLFPRQREWIEWVLAHWRGRTPGLCEKSRDMGISWCAVALSSTLCIFNDGVSIGFTSHKDEYVDHLGDMKALFPKARKFLAYLPVEFSGGFVEWRDAPFGRIMIPETGSVITGEVGDNIGRGDRKSLYFVDESAHLKNAGLVEFALSQTTNCRIDMSSVNGMGNPFANKRFGGKIDYFIFDWREDPRKDQTWYEKQVTELDPVVLAQEVDRDYLASVEGVVIPGEWLRSCIDACAKLGIEPSGKRRAALDVADEGADKNAFVTATGVEVDFADLWSGKGSDIYKTASKAIDFCDELGLRDFRYDEDGLGAGVRGDVRVINATRKAAGARPAAAEGWRGSSAVIMPEGIVEGTRGFDGTDKGRTNKDYFYNRKAQGWWALRNRAKKTHKWVKDGIACDPDEILSISSKCPLYQKIIAELSQPTYAMNTVGKMVIDKKPKGMASPNLGDAVMMLFAPGDPVVSVSRTLVQAVAALPRRRRY